MAKQNFSGYLKALQLLFFALFMGQIVFAGVLYLLFPDPPEPDPENGLFLYGVPVLMAGGILAAFFISKQQIENARLQADLSGRLSLYFKMCLMRWGISEGVTLFGLAAYFFFFGHPALLGLSLLGIAFFGTLFPSRNGIVSVLDLSATDQARLDDPSDLVVDNP